MEASTIITELEENGFIEMETENDMLTINFRKFFGADKKFLFTFNCKPIFDCKGKKTALKKINEFIDKGFQLTEDNIFNK